MLSRHAGSVSYSTSYKLTHGTYDILRSNDYNNCQYVIHTREVCIVWAGPDDHTSLYKSILQLLVMKSSSSLYEPIYTIRTYMLSRVWCTG